MLIQNPVIISAFILLYTTGDNIVQRSIAKQKLQMNLVMDYELSDLIKTTSLAINHVLYQSLDVNVNDNLGWLKLFDNLKRVYQYKLPIQMSYFGRFDQSMVGLELTYVRIFHKSQNAVNLTRPVTDYHVINDIDNILAPSNIMASYYSSVDMTARPWYKPFVNTTNPKILWSPFFYSALSLYPSIAACIPIYINSTISSLNANYSSTAIYPSSTAPRIPSHLFGVIGIQLNVKNISDTLTKSAIRAGVAASFIINSQGQMVAATKFLGYPSLQNESDIIMNALLQGLAIKEAGSFFFQTGQTPTLDIVLFTITDQYGLNWGSVIAVPQRLFVEEVLQSNRVSFISLSTDLFSEIYEIVENHKGSIDKYAGNRIVAYWNGPKTSVKDHEILACNAAVQIVQCLAKLNSRWRKINYPCINFGLSINSGNFLAGNIGTNSRINFTVLGDDANVASGITKLNRKFGTQVLIGHNTFEKSKINLFAIL
ncbi:hypothetical protein FDP41_013324 [Naegleria fowleri]|uniref:Guanylate cyclase domain-containing protein n=1 Tax=Naegleria fowleri TaxID=5763 RepID=A0A6A5C1H7_NAEFO|nr:uncharacterized protein FDP41_013324 [Naegleria fowleri]KAF0980841.1 hypothetical protein FDP41_013324 [Naegleria fowleri]